MLSEHGVLECGPRDNPTTLFTLRLSKVDGNSWHRPPALGLDLGIVDQKARQQWTKADIFIVPSLARHLVSDPATRLLGDL